MAKDKSDAEKRVAINRAAKAAVTFLRGTRPTKAASELPPRIALVRALAKGLRELEPADWRERLNPVLDEIARDAHLAQWPHAEEIVAREVASLIAELDS